MNLIKEPYEISLWKDQIMPVDHGKVEIDGEEMSINQFLKYGSYIDYAHPLIYKIIDKTNSLLPYSAEEELKDILKGQVYFARDSSLDAEYTVVLPIIKADILSLFGPLTIGYPGSNQENVTCIISLLESYNEYHAQYINYNNLLTLTQNYNCGIILNIKLHFYGLVPQRVVYPILSLTDSNSNNILPNRASLWYKDETKIYTANNFFEDYSNEYLTEKLVTKLGSNTSTSLNRPMQPKFVDNLNGSHTLTFTLYDKYIDPFTNEQTHNPFIDMIKNESKIKIKLKDKWYDFVVKQIDSSSDKKTYTYTCKDQYINELSKQGYNVEFDTELMNNIDTADRLAATAIKDSGWEVRPIAPEEPEEGQIYSDILEEKHSEPLVKYTKDDIDYYVSYSDYKNKKTSFYYWKFETGAELKVDENYVLVDECEKEPKENFEWADIIVEVTPYYGEVPQKGKLYKYDPVTQKVVQLYEEYKINGQNEKEKVGDFYTFTENEFVSPTLVSNYITNGSNFSSTSGWSIDNGGSVKLDYRKSSWRLDSENNQINYPVLTCRFSEESLLKNTGISNNLSKIKSFTKGEKYVLRILASRTALANAGKMISGESPYNAKLRLNSTETLRNPSGEENQELGANSNEKNTVPMTWRSYWDYWENHGDFTNVYPITQGRGIGGVLAEYTLENGCYKIIKTYAEFKYGHSTEPLCLEDFPINHRYHLEDNEKIWTPPYDDNDQYSQDNNAAYIKDPNIQTFIKEGDNTGTQYCRLAFFKDLLTFDRADQAYGNESLSKRDDVEYMTNPEQHRQTHKLKYEDDPFYIPLYEKGLGFNIQSNQYKYMIGEIKESITEEELRTKQIALFLKSNGPFAWNANNVENTIDTAKQDYGYPIKDSTQNWNQTHKIIQDIYIEDVQFFPFKTKKANFQAEVVPTINGYLNGQLKSVESGQSEQWLDEDEVSPKGKIFNGDELILPETAPDAEAINRTVWKSYYPTTISNNENEFSDEFTEEQVTKTRLQTSPTTEGSEYIYPLIANLSNETFGNKLANNFSDTGDLPTEKEQVIQLLLNLIGDPVLNTENIIIENSRIKLGNQLSNYEHQLYLRLADNEIYEENFIIDDVTGQRVQSGWKLKSGQEAPSFETNLDNLKKLIIFHPEKYTSISSVTKLDQIDYFYSGTEAPELVKPEIWNPKTNDTFEKYRMIQGKDSNYFDILQKICESFECWMDFKIDHESDGKISYTNVYDEYGFIVGKKPNKTIIIKEKRGDQNYAQFRTAINLKDSVKKSDSTNFATHLIVANNTNEFGEDGFCSISRAENNPLKENYLFNFDYYTQTDRIDRSTLMNDLYGENGYYTQIAKINEDKPVKIKKLSSLLVDLTKLEANVDFYQKAYDSAQAATLEALADFNAYKSKNEGEIDCSTATEGIAKYEADYINDKQARSYGIKLITNNSNAINYLARLSYWQKQYNNEIVQLLELQNWQRQTTEKISELTRIFYNKYQSYIADAKWSSNDYTNDDLYYFESQRKLAVAAKPKVTYTFSVISLDKLPGYEGYKFKVGDRVQVIDTDFFGYESDGITPKKVEVIVTELIQDLDNPDKTTVKVQTYQDNFTSLFQRITSSVNQLK